MKWSRVHVIGFFVVSMSLCGGLAVEAGELQAWGNNSCGQVSDLPMGSDYVAVAAGDEHALALGADGKVVAWGQNGDRQCDVPSGTYKAIAAGACFSLAVRSGGSIVAWGNDDTGQVSDAPADSGYVAVAGGLNFAVALRANGTVVAWGDDRYGQVSDAPRTADFVAVAAGDGHAVALHEDGSLTAWGYWGAVEGMPESGSYAAISAGDNHCLALTDDGAIVWWGDAPAAYELDKVPEGKGYIGIAAGYLHDLAIESNGSAVGWGAGIKAGGQPNWGQADPPTGYEYVALAGGLYFSVGLTKSPVSGALTDDFNDNSQAAMWSLDTDDSSTCWLEETNRRLELRATDKANWASASYLAKGWTVDPADDFSLRVDYARDIELGDSTWLSVVLMPSADSQGSRHIGFGVGSGDSYPYLWFEAIDDSIKYNKSTYRSDEEGTLFISYDASADVLYLSDRGYGAENAWATSRNLLQGAWAGQTLVVGLGGGSDSVTIDSGQACLDNFVLESAGSAVEQLQAVYRFWSPLLGSHFYTPSEAERDEFILDHADAWIYEGGVFSAASTAFNADLAPVYCFRAEKTGAHFYTIDEAEKDQFLKEGQSAWTFEGVAFYAYPVGQQPAGTTPLYQFSNDVSGGYFYTISENEKDSVIRKYRNVFSFEGIAFYVYP